MSKNNIQSYLKKIYELESFIYTQHILKNDINKKIDNLSNWRYKSLYSLKPEKYPEIETKWYSNLILVITIMIMVILGRLILEIDLDKMISDASQDSDIFFIVAIILYLAFWWLIFFIEIIYKYKIFFSVLFGIIVGLIIHFCVFMRVHKFFADKKYTAEYANKMQIINNNIECENIENRKKIERKINELRKELNIIIKEIQKAEETLRLYYEKNIIYDKYRYFVAISSFCEYFESGRCTMLTGHEGAYNIYENEIRQNVIISQLNEVIKHLKQIESNQYMIYNAINQANKIMQNISQQIDVAVDKMDNNMDLLNSNIQIIEYNTKNFGTKNTEFLKWINAFEYYERQS